MSPEKTNKNETQNLQKSVKIDPKGGGVHKHAFRTENGVGVTWAAHLPPRLPSCQGTGSKTSPHRLHLCPFDRDLLEILIHISDNSTLFVEGMDAKS